MAFFAMRYVAGLAVPSVVRWGSQDFQATDPEFNPAIHDQVPLRSDSSQTPGVPLRHHTTSIVAPDVVDHTLAEMANQADKDAADAVVGVPLRSLLDFADGKDQSIGNSGLVIVGAVCFNPFRLLGNPGGTRMVATFAYDSTSTIEVDILAQHDSGPTVVLPVVLLPASPGSFVRVEVGPTGFIPANDELIEFHLRANKTAAGQPASLRSMTLSFVEDADTGGGG